MFSIVFFYNLRYSILKANVSHSFKCVCYFFSTNVFVLLYVNRSDGVFTRVCICTGFIL